MERELKEGDRIVDWDGVHGTARNVRDDGFSILFDFHQDDGEIVPDYGWVEEDDVGAFMFEVSNV